MITRQPEDNLIKKINGLCSTEEVKALFECDNAQACATKIEQLEALFKDSNLSVAARAVALRGYMHRHGLGGPVNYPQAIRHFESAIEHGEIGAMDQRAHMHEYGQGGPINLPEALRLYQLANVETCQIRIKGVKLQIEAQQLHEKIKQKASSLFAHAIKPDAMHAALKKQANDERKLFTTIQHLLETRDESNKKKNFLALINQIVNYPATIDDLLKHPEQLCWLSNDMLAPYPALAQYIKTYLDHQKIKNDYVERVKNCLLALQTDISTGRWKIKNWQGEWVTGLPTHIARIKKILAVTHFADTDHILKQYTAILKILNGISNNQRRHPHTSLFYTDAKAQLGSILYYHEPAPAAAASTVAASLPLQLIPATSAPQQTMTPPPSYEEAVTTNPPPTYVSGLQILSPASDDLYPRIIAAPAANVARSEASLPPAIPPTFFTMFPPASQAPALMPAASAPLTSAAEARPYDTQTFIAMFPPAPSSPLPALPSENRQLNDASHGERVTASRLVG